MILNVALLMVAAMVCGAWIVFMWDDRNRGGDEY